VLEFTEMMDTLLASGLSLRDSLEMTASAGAAAEGASGAGNAYLRRGKQSGAALAAEEILSGLGRGASFAGALCALEKTFPPVYRGMISVGDKAGSVEKIFPRLAVFLREQRAIRDKTAAALAYPALVLFIALAGSLALALLVLPRLESVFSAFGGGAGETVSRNIAAIKTAFLRLGAGLLVSATVIVAARFAGGADRGAELLDRLILSLPLAGRFIVSWETLNFSFAMEALTAGGISVEAGLIEAEAVLSNRHYRRALEKVRGAVMNGGSLSAAFAGAGVFPPYFCRWVSVGESSGRSEGVFTQIRTWFQGEIEKQTQRFLLLIEPALIAIIGILILILVTAIVLPLFEAYGNLL
jgi:type II secretory pathway component PulF